MLCRVFFIFTPDALTVIAWIGGFTALLAALIAVQQNDIKRILAYSTLSQLGYMVMAVGLGGPTPAMFHLTTHAFFKALLFLGAGSVIIALHHDQAIGKMGAVGKKMPVTFWTFLVGPLALWGVPPFSGFYSKDAILAQAWHAHNYPLFALAVFVAVLTTFYMFRLFFVALVGEPKTHEAGHAHESPGVMIWPLRILAVASIAGGVIGISEIFNLHFLNAGLPEFVTHGKTMIVEPIGPVLLPEPSFAERIIEPFQHSPVAAFGGLAAFVIGLLAAK